jgi:hypothetical protein
MWRKLQITNMIFETNQMAFPVVNNRVEVSNTIAESLMQKYDTHALNVL